MDSAASKHLISTIEDITERQRAEEALRASEERFRSIVESSPVAMYFYDLQPSDRLVLTGANPSADRFIGISHASLLGKTIEEAFPALSATDVPDMYRKVARGELGPQSFEIEYHDARFFGAYDVHVFRIGPQAIAVAFTEISERKRAQEERERLQAQLSQAQKLESVGRLAGGVAHDFNNMLSVILGRTEIALSKLQTTDPVFADLLEVKKAAERSANLTRQLLAFARKQTIAPKVLDLNETVEGMLKMLRRLIGEDITLNWKPGPNLWPVKMDPSQLDQVLANLCINARDAIADVGNITLKTRNITLDDSYCSAHPEFTRGEYVMLVVSDNGCGMDRQTLAQIFEPFYTTKSPDKGTGLGLATVYGAITQNGGLIGVESEPGKGTTFRIYLPRHAEPVVTEQPSRPSASTVCGQETILLVEDEPAILRMASAVLARQGYTVLAASTPGEAIRLASSHEGKIHLLLTDVVMPQMNGRDLAEKVRALHPGLKPIFMSGYTAEVIAPHGMLNADVAFIQKPFTLSGLATKVRQVLEQA